MAKNIERKLQELDLELLKVTNANPSPRHAPQRLVRILDLIEERNRWRALLKCFKDRNQRENTQ